MVKGQSATVIATGEAVRVVNVLRIKGYLPLWTVQFDDGKIREYSEEELCEN